MSVNLFTLAISLICASLSLLFLPDFMLIGWKQTLLCNLVFTLTAFLFYWFKKIWLFHFFIILNVIALAFGYTHAFALNLLQQANEILPEKQNLVLQIEDLLHQQQYQTVIARTILNKKEQRIFLNWKEEAKPFLGEKWQGEVSIRPLSARLNLGGFDRQQWYFSQGVTASGSLKSAVKIDSDFSWREKKLWRALKQTEALSLQGLLIALAFGERAWLDQTTWQVYQQTNTGHLIAISGLHIGLAMGMGFLLARATQFFFPTRYIKPAFPLWCGAFLALFYAYLSGFSVPTLRAVSALLFVLTIQSQRRYYSAFRLFILIIAFLLLCDPLMPLSISFWLSIGAVFCLIIWYRYVPLSLFQWRYQPFSLKVRWILGLFHLQFGLLLLFTPLQLILFNGISLSGFFANLVAVPLYSFFLVPVILFAVLSDGMLYSWQLANHLAEGITQIITLFQGRWFSISLNLSLILTALFSLFFLLITLRIYSEKRVLQKDWKIKAAKYFTLDINRSLPIIWKKQAVWGSVGIAVLSLLIVIIRQYQKPVWQLDTLDVGQGLATLIVKNGRGILYDTGSAWQGGSMAELEILPYLQREGINLDKLILSHDDNDHSGGTKAILKNYPNVELISSSEKNYGESHRTFCIAGKEWEWQEIHFRILSPQKVVARADNPNSCVILLEDGKHRVLLTGDAETKNEQIFARTLGKINVLQVGHHGSKTSTGELLLSHTKPDLAIISSGRWNPWHFPHLSVMKRLKQHQSEVENTAVSGQIRVSFYHDKWKVSRQRTAFFPWYARPIGLSTE
ncbi:DNA internalization-related competence protein ComEC/Rec2 [Rodentibacter pneumotropicus]|uniref:DNA internalization-related competence protein ComEC/Rec2 n=1 Tax=Rodentibacter pneumotropicus TaxID=758 RepID=UPI0009852EBD|nr:DNA internalization-related competence protein ComEC/Rec2 [Rodentibacter pneumotropicus]OOF64528.1 DNA internalization-related competence protein ComEC/Rec2 [Rodentibacter pneumotropicus]